MNFKYLALVLLVPLLCAAAPSPEAFTSEMIGRLKAHMTGTTLESEEPLVVHMKGGEWNDATINLHRIYQYCQSASAADCESEKATFVDNMTAKWPEPTLPSLRLIVRDRQYVDSLRNMDAKAGPVVLFEPIGDDLYAVLASDSPKGTTLIGVKGLKELDITREQAWALALTQTQVRLPKLPEPSQLQKGVGFQDYEYLGSLLIDLPAWAKLAQAVGPDLLVTVTSDQFVFVGMMPDGPKFDEFKKTVAEDCDSAPRCISPYIYRFRDGKWAAAR